MSNKQRKNNINNATNINRPRNTRRRQQAIMGSFIRFFIGVAALVGYFVKVSGGDPISKWILMAMFGIVLMFWGVLDFTDIKKGKKR